MIKGERLTIEDCTFTENSCGLRGSAIYVRNFNRVKITRNDFSRNWPVYVDVEEYVSPYYIHLAKSPLTFFDEAEICYFEADYQSKCN